MNLILFIVSKTGWTLDYIFGSYCKYCKQTNDKCNQGSCIYFHNKINTEYSLDCKNIDIKFNGLTIRQITIISLFFRYYDSEYLLNFKAHLVDILNGMYSKTHKALNWKNSFSNTLLSTLFTEQMVDKSDRVGDLVYDILIEKNIDIKFEKFNKLKTFVFDIYYNETNLFYILIKMVDTIFGDFFNNYNVINNILDSDATKLYIINIFTTIFKLFIQFPTHSNIAQPTDENVHLLKTKINAGKIGNNVVNYLNSDWDDERLSDYTSSDNLMLYISSIDSYYYIYKKYNNKDKNLYLLFDIYDYIESVSKNSNELLTSIFVELMGVLKTSLMMKYNIDIDNIF